jgi:hypothetical protein
MFLTPLAMQMLSPQEQQSLGQAFGQKIQMMQQQGGPPPGPQQNVPPPMGGGMPGGDPRRMQMAQALGGM